MTPNRVYLMKSRLFMPISQQFKLIRGTIHFLNITHFITNILNKGLSILQFVRLKCAGSHQPPLLITLYLLGWRSICGELAHMLTAMQSSVLQRAGMAKTSTLMISDLYPALLVV